MLKCANGTLYTGWTDDVLSRVEAHNSGKGAKYTRANRPVKLVASWQFPSKSEAMKWEWKVKQLSRQEKLKLITDSA
jgi:putative endonuclease